MYIVCLDYCEYKGQQYKLHETWDDGCQWQCECVDDKIGKYSCTEKYVIQLIIFYLFINSLDIIVLFGFLSV